MYVLYWIGFFFIFIGLFFVFIGFQVSNFKNLSFESKENAKITYLVGYFSLIFGIAVVAATLFAGMLI